MAGGLACVLFGVTPYGQAPRRPSRLLSAGLARVDTARKAELPIHALRAVRGEQAAPHPRRAHQSDEAPAERLIVGQQEALLARQLHDSTRINPCYGRNYRPAVRKGGSPRAAPG
jgi:hypothetical protein